MKLKCAYHTRNQRLDLESELSGLTDNYKTVAKPGTPAWSDHRTCSLLVAERGFKITGPCKSGQHCHGYTCEGKCFRNNWWRQKEMQK